MKNSKKFFFLILFFSIFLIPISSFFPYVNASENIEYISATDILKNFKFETIGGEPIVDEGAFNNKLRFDTQASWLLFRNDIIPLTTIESESSTILKYRIVLRNKINIYTNVRLSQMTSNMKELQESFLGVKYRHNNLGGSIDYAWEQYINWECYDFGDIKYYNEMNNVFDGRIVMSFDIDDNPIPDTFGEYTEKNFDHIAVSDAGIITHSYGLMSDDMPEIIVLSPSESESEMRDDYTEDGQGANVYNEVLDPKTDLYAWVDPTKSFDGGVLPDTPGSSMNPTNKDGTPTWDPEAEEKSMVGGLINYDLGRISPVVYLWQGRLKWTETDLETEKYLVWDWGGIHTVVKTNHRYIHDYIEYRDVALHGINRYLQVDMYVAFDIWTSVKLGTLTEEYEYLKLYQPEEYYDALIWSTLAGGWTGSYVEEHGQDLFEVEWWGDIVDWFGNIFGDFGNIVIWIIILAVIGIGVYIFFVIGGPLIRRKRK